MALLLYAVTLFVSAFILFLVQPMISKMILPKLGGTPQVWNTCMVFFQMVLLAGYAYTHSATTRLKLWQQLLIHCALLFLPFLVLLPNGPFPVEGWKPTLGANPFFETLLLLMMIVGIPFFVVSTSAPLLQKWFASTGHSAAKDPYFLYGASNLGSMLGLWSYPFLIEWMFDLREQAYIWTGLYGLLILMVIICAAMVWAPASAASRLQLATAAEAPVHEMVPASTAVTTEAPAPAPAVTGIKKPSKSTPRGPGERLAADISLPHGGGDEMTTWRRVRWVLLAAVPVSLMLGVTTHITTDLSPIPLFWVVPLSLYLLSFILVFMRWPVPWVGEPHRIVLYAMPVLMALMIFVEMYALRDSDAVFASIFFDLAGFFATAMVCHGELAKDRPSTRHLTEFFLLMSFGGMLGGMFNGLVAPLLFVYVWEFNLAVMAACLLRPAMRDSGWIDNYLAQSMGGGAAPARGGKPTPRSPITDTAANTTKMLDFALPGAVTVLCLVLSLMMSTSMRSNAFQFPMFVAYGLPLVLACLMLARPLRFGLAMAGIILVHGFDQSRYDRSEYADRSYFGIIRVQKSAQPIGTGKSAAEHQFYQLIHGRINHGMNFIRPDDVELGDKDKDFSRLATTYYHRLGPAGRVMELYNWNSDGRANTYNADARMPGYILGTLAGDLNGGLAPVPSSLFVGLHSEPAYATVGLGTGTMASYGRPYQHVHYYEIDNHIRRLSLPVDEKNVYFTHESLDLAPAKGRRKTYFSYLQDAIRRGSEVHVYMGDARLRMDLPYKNFHEAPNDAGGPENFYHMMVVDAFSSDAIPVHLITKQSIAMYFKKLKEDGILCVHTSNRYVNLPLVVGAVANDLGYAYMRGHDMAPGSENKSSTSVEEVGHFISDWVMVARKREQLPKDLWSKDGKTPWERLLKMEPSNYREQMRRKGGDAEYWKPNSPTPDPRFVWTDDHSNLFQVLRWRLPKELQ